MNQVWHNPTATLHKTLIIHNGRVFVGSAVDNQLAHIDELLAKNESPMLLLGDKSVCLNDQKLRRIESEAASTDITMKYQRDGKDRFTIVSLPDTNARDLALTQLEQVFGLHRVTEQWSTVRSARGPLIALGLVAFAVFLFSNAAAELSHGEEATVKGRHRGLKVLFMFVLNTIGPTGVYIAGGLLSVLALYWLVQRIKNPLKVTTLTPSA